MQQVVARVLLRADVQGHIEDLDEQVQDGQLLVVFDGLVQCLNEATQAERRTADVDEAGIGPHQVD